jgi:hypothetical protein
MPRLSDDTILQRAIEPAILDRESFAGAHGGQGKIADDANALANAIRAIQGKRLAKMSESELLTAYRALLYGEQWESSLADSLWPGKNKSDALKNASMFNAVRMRRWGKTTLERELEGAQSRPIRDFFDAAPT